MNDDQFNQLAKDILSSMYGFIAVDSEGKIAYIGRGYADALGLTQEECIGHQVEELIPNTRMHIVLRNKKAEIGRFMLPNFSGPGSICNRMLIYRNGKPAPDNIAGAMAFSLIASKSDTTLLTKELNDLHRQIDMYQNHIAQIYQASYEPEEILGSSRAMREVKDLIARTAASSVTVCILGETGTGKELVANAIHKMSRRADKPFVKINCAAIPKDLMESELFGYEPGAFTSASRRGKLGKFELANHGTLLLDEIGELSPDLQVKLLRVLQAGEVERVGGTSPIPIDVRVICSTNRDLPQMVRDGTFRADLYYRINTMEILVPPLRERREDIPELVAHFTEEARDRNGLVITGISDEAVQTLMAHDWPGNVRELEHAIERACVLCGRGQLEPRHFNSITAVSPFVSSSDKKEITAPSLRDKTGSLEKESILQALDACHGNKRAAAEMLGITRTTLYSKLKKYDIAL